MRSITFIKLDSSVSESILTLFAVLKSVSDNGFQTLSSEYFSN